MKTFSNIVMVNSSQEHLDSAAAQLLQEVREWEYFLNQLGNQSPSHRVARQLLRGKEDALARVLLEKSKRTHYH